MIGRIIFYITKLPEFFHTSVIRSQAIDFCDLHNTMSVNRNRVLTIIHIPIAKQRHVDTNMTGGYSPVIFNRNIEIYDLVNSCHNWS